MDEKSLVSIDQAKDAARFDAQVNAVERDGGTECLF